MWVLAAVTRMSLTCLFAGVCPLFSRSVLFLQQLVVCYAITSHESKLERLHKVLGQMS